MPLPDQPTPLANRFLIAQPSLGESGFSRSVMLVCQHDDDGALGVMVNRPSEYTVGDVLSQLGFEGGDDRLRAQPVLNGGPVHRERGFVIHDGGLRWDSTLVIGQDLYLTTSREILEAMASGQGPEHALIALGCAGWDAGQLEQELSEDNSWLTAPADAELLFDMPLDERWQAAAGRLGVDFAHLAHYAGHA